MTLIAGRYQPLDAARPGAPLRARDLQTAQSVILREVSLPQEGAEDALRRAQAAVGSASIANEGSPMRSSFAFPFRVISTELCDIPP